MTGTDVMGHLLPEDAIVSDEGNTAGAYAARATAGAPLTTGCASPAVPSVRACPRHRRGHGVPRTRVIALQADGSAMYSPQSLWTMARERLDVTTLLLNNRSYAVLNMELDRVGATAGGPRAKAMLDLSDPELDMVALASAMGVPADRATTCEELAAQLAASLDTPGPTLIDRVLP